MTDAILNALLPFALNWLAAHLPDLIQAGVGLAATAAGVAATKYLGAARGKKVEETLAILAPRIGDAIARGVAQSQADTPEGRADEAVAYVQKTMPQAIRRAGLTPDQIRARTLAEARNARRD